jgi:tetratricopeptide (TPR) repeat protein
MKSFDNIIKLEEIKKRMDSEDYIKAQSVLDSMDIRKIKNITDLNILAEVYTRNGRYDEAMEIFLKIYEKTRTRKSLYQLIWIAIKKGNAEEAEDFLSEYQKVASDDFSYYIFRYKIDKLKGESFETLISTLEELKKTEYIEQWAYELAKLYYKAGMEEECIQECNDIILWFAEGSYVEKAKVLKSYFSGEVSKDMILEMLKQRAKEEKPDSKENEPANQVLVKSDNDWNKENEPIQKVKEKELLDREEAELQVEQELYRLLNEEEKQIQEKLDNEMKEKD